MGSSVPALRAHFHAAVFAAVALGGASGCGASVSMGSSHASSTQADGRPTGTAQARSAVAEQPQRPGTCQIAPPQVRIPIGEWTATETILRTNAIDFCAGERLVRPWDFRRRCNAGNCKTYLFTVGYYGIEVAEVVPDGQGRFVAAFRPKTVPCPHRPGEDAGTNQALSTTTLWWSSDRQTLHGLSRDSQVGACGGGPPETSSYVATRTDPTAQPPAEGP
jgi:hypothetical protein